MIWPNLLCTLIKSLLLGQANQNSISVSCKKPITFVTGNAQKVEELKAILKGSLPVEITNHELDLPEYQGEIEEITVRKCQEAAKRIKVPVLVEDTSLGFNALEGLPGPYIKWFLEKVGPEGLVKLLTGWEDKSAVFITIYAYCDGSCDDLDVVLFKGVTKGKIVPPRGGVKYGLDSIFEPDDSVHTYAEMQSEEKNKISQRYKALVKLGCYLKEHYQ